MKSRQPNTAPKRGAKLGSPPTVQLTVRGVPAHVDQALRRKAAAEHRSLNDVLVEALQIGSGVGQERVYRDLDFMAGTWVEDPAFEEAIAKQDQIDDELWK